MKPKKWSTKKKSTEECRRQREEGKQSGKDNRYKKVKNASTAAKKANKKKSQRALSLTLARAQKLERILNFRKRDANTQPPHESAITHILYTGSPPTYRLTSYISAHALDRAYLLYIGDLSEGAVGTYVPHIISHHKRRRVTASLLNSYVCVCVCIYMFIYIYICIYIYIYIYILSHDTSVQAHY